MRIMRNGSAFRSYAASCVPEEGGMAVPSEPTVRTAIMEGKGCPGLQSPGQCPVAADSTRRRSSPGGCAVVVRKSHQGRLPQCLCKRSLKAEQVQIIAGYHSLGARDLPDSSGSWAELRGVGHFATEVPASQVIVSSEILPWSNSGGLGRVTASLARPALPHTEGLEMQPLRPCLEAVCATRPPHLATRPRLLLTQLSQIYVLLPPGPFLRCTRSHRRRMNSPTWDRLLGCPEPWLLVCPSAFLLRLG